MWKIKVISEEWIHDYRWKQNFIEFFAQPPWNEKWTMDDVTDYIEKAAKRHDFVGFIALNKKGEIDGYVWGYEINPKDLKIEVNEERAFYIDVVNSNVELDLIKKSLVLAFLAIALYREVKKKGFKCLVGRTHTKAYGMRKLVILGGFKPLGIRDEVYPDRDYLVKILQSNFADTFSCFKAVILFLAKKIFKNFLKRVKFLLGHF